MPKPKFGRLAIQCMFYSYFVISFCCIVLLLVEFFVVQLIYLFNMKIVKVHNVDYIYTAPSQFNAKNQLSIGEADRTACARRLADANVVESILLYKFTRSLLYAFPFLHFSFLFVPFLGTIFKIQLGWLVWESAVIKRFPHLAWDKVVHYETSLVGQSSQPS